MQLNEFFNSKGNQRKLTESAGPECNFVKITYDQFEHLPSARIENDEINGFGVIAAYDPNDNCIALYYKKAKYGSSCPEFKGDLMSYSEQDSLWPEMYESENVDEGNPENKQKRRTVDRTVGQNWMNQQNSFSDFERKSNSPLRMGRGVNQFAKSGTYNALAKGEMAEAGIPDVDHMHGEQGIGLDRVTDARDLMQKDFAVYTDQDLWSDDVSRVNSELFDDDADFQSDQYGMGVVINGVAFAGWNHGEGTGYINVKTARMNQATPSSDPQIDEVSVGKKMAVGYRAGQRYIDAHNTDAYLRKIGANRLANDDVTGKQKQVDTIRRSGTMGKLASVAGAVKRTLETTESATPPNGMSAREYAQHERGRKPKPKLRVGATVRTSRGAGTVKELYTKQLASGKPAHFMLIVDSAGREDRVRIRQGEYTVTEGYTVLPNIDTDRYQERNGLEGPFRARNGTVVYYDPREGRYYNPDSDHYISNEDWFAMNEAINMGALTPELEVFIEMFPQAEEAMSNAIRNFEYAHDAADHVFSSVKIPYPVWVKAKPAIIKYFKRYGLIEGLNEISPAVKKSYAVKAAKSVNTLFDKGQAMRKQGDEAGGMKKLDKAVDRMTAINRLHNRELDIMRKRTGGQAHMALMNGNDQEDTTYPYVCVHARKGTCDVRAKTSYEAAKLAAAKWKLKGTAGIDAYRADVKHIATESQISEGGDGADSDGLRPYVCVHARKGTCDVRAKTSYEAAKLAAAKWKLKGTAGIDAHLADVKHVARESRITEGGDGADSDGLRPYVCVHARKGICEVRAKTSYEAAKLAAAKWQLRGTAGIDVYRDDVKHIATESQISEGNDQDSQLLAQLKSLQSVGISGVDTSDGSDVHDTFVYLSDIEALIRQAERWVPNTKRGSIAEGAGIPYNVEVITKERKIITVTAITADDATESAEEMGYEVIRAWPQD